MIQHVPFLRKLAHTPRSRYFLASAVTLLAVETLHAPAYCQSQERSSVSAEPRAASMKDANTYRLTYSISESDRGKQIGVQHFSLSVVPNGRAADLKQGSRNPVLTGGYLHEGSPETTQFQFTYLDVGLELNALLSENAEGMQLTAKIVQSALADAMNPQTLKDPVVQQNTIDVTSYVKLGVPVVLGSYDVPGSTRHFEVVALLERASQ